MRARRAGLTAAFTAALCALAAIALYVLTSASAAPSVGPVARVSRTAASAIVVGASVRAHLGGHRTISTERRVRSEPAPVWQPDLVALPTTGVGAVGVAVCTSATRFESVIRDLASVARTVPTARGPPSGCDSSSVAASA